MSTAPIIYLVVDLLGVLFPVFGLFILPLFFELPILRLFVSLFLTLALAFTFSLSFKFSGRQGLEV